MPYKSRAEMAWLHIHKPDVAAKWDKEFGSPGRLPYHVKKRRKRKVRMRRET